MLRCLLLIVAITSGCQYRTNPSLKLSPESAKTALGEMREHPCVLERPVVILGGFTDIGLGTSILRSQLQPMLDDRRVLTVTFADCTSFEQCRARVVAAVDEKFGRGDEANQTIEVDVIGQSMGGLVALVACSDLGDGARRLNVRRLFALSSPLQGARLAERTPVTFTSMHRDMKPDSQLYQRLKNAPRTAQVFAYTRLNDQIVGEHYAAPAGQTPYWLDSPTPVAEHWLGVLDPRALADIARRLRGEEAFATSPPAALPG